MVMVPHGPNDLGAHALAGGLHDPAQLGVCLGLAFVGEVAGKNDRLRPGTGRGDFGEDLAQPLLTVHSPVKGIRAAQQVGVAQVKQEVARPGMFGLDEVHDCLNGRVDAANAAFLSYTSIHRLGELQANTADNLEQRLWFTPLRLAGRPERNHPPRPVPVRGQ